MTQGKSNLTKAIEMPSLIRTDDDDWNAGGSFGQLLRELYVRSARGSRSGRWIPNPERYTMEQKYVCCQPHDLKNPKTSVKSLGIRLEKQSAFLRGNRLQRRPGSMSLIRPERFRASADQKIVSSMDLPSFPKTFLA